MLLYANNCMPHFVLISLHALCCVWVCVSVCVSVQVCAASLSLPAVRQQPNPVSSTIITWFLHNALAGRDELLYLPQEIRSCSDSSLFQQNYRELYSEGFISVRINRTIREARSVRAKCAEDQISQLWLHDKLTFHKCNCSSFHQSYFIISNKMS